MLHERFPQESLSPLLLPRNAYHPFPTAGERRAWETLPTDLHTRIISDGEKYLDHTWPQISATRLLDYTRNGDRSRHGDLYFPRRVALKALVNAECAEGQGRFLDDIINGIWALCEESSWCIPAHSRRDGVSYALPDVDNPIIDLFAAETGAVLAWTHYLLGEQLDAVTPLITARVRREVGLRILGPYLDSEFYWMGAPWWKVNNWNPWCNSNCLVAILLLEEDPQRRIAAVAKALRSLDYFLAGYHDDGGCDEGPGYWAQAGGALFDALELLYGASDGHIDVYSEPLIREIGRYIMRAHISGGYFTNFADCAARCGIAADLVYRFGQRIDDPALMAMGASAVKGPPVVSRFNFFRELSAIFNWHALSGVSAQPPYVRDVWMPGIQVMAAREQAGSDHGLYLAAKGGHNAESHNHNDVGSCVVYLDGAPLLLDIGVETYSKKTFSQERYTIWTMQSAYHNLPTVNGVMQQPGEEAAAREVAYRADDAQATFALDIAAAYPPEASIERWRRAYRFDRGVSPAIEITDSFTLQQATEAITVSFLTPGEPVLRAPGMLCLDGRAQFTFDAAQLTATIERLPVEDGQLQAVWGDHIFRILLSPTSATAQGEWTVRLSR